MNAIGAIQRYRRGAGWAALVLALALLAGCGARVELLGAAPENEANEVLAALLEAGIAAQKQSGKAGYAVSVPAEAVARSLEILRASGLPREQFDGMGRIFRKEGLVSSPLEERARYIYALSQELADTLSQIDGVLSARVHVVLPERGAVGEPATPSTAGVFLKYRDGQSLDALVPEIRKLVTHAIPGLAEDRVSVALVVAQPVQAAPAPVAWRRVLGVQVADGSVLRFSLLLLLLPVLCLIVAGAALYVWRTRWSRGEGRGGAGAGATEGAGHD
ncbi:type III secretion protein [Bordetella pertussis]|uniref:Lipoprotein n=4 Tax=Bordetella pertussis TaxID=520 RepID=Q79GQ6_BORPE|nr:SctJ family type III secretion inner membrane ring lipoprotein Bsc [Bordetella pertussis]ETH38937.1 type III secretion apparatus lipoprotein, YscJ/HrcJ family [Bordetella pertussis H918]ETH44873.1 type III secretion apparatus lipoprotein, YscJ/HrcJ family [Bordetella pertussis H939]ETH48301.1 type III secretion apparatus lipoprotein, YscJ/HrcJ family [Bordetella pertussis H921]ETH71118.1 type III secretion apparatus lipoprotein, YscJ/HrcJ family [Bordetella pertussis STO1-CHLA-0011]ETH84101